MLESPNPQQFATILSRSGLSEVRLADLLGVHQSTVSRLKNCKIKKIERYWVAFKMSDVPTDGIDEQFAERMADLERAARHSPTLRVLLQKLHEIMQERKDGGP